MPPPPAPAAPGILVPEVTALATCLKNAVVKTGQLYGFYADTRKLGIQNYAPSPPSSLTAALGREVEKYDQLCDSIESQLASTDSPPLRAISVLQRDLAREERRIKEAEAEAEAKAKTIAGRTRSASRSPTSTRIPLPVIDFTAANGDGSRPSTADPALSPPLSSSSIPGRRPSAISISSLHRPTLPPKLDLSANSLRISAEEASLFSQGLSSPVTLAPRSARPYGPNELPPDLMAALASASSSEASRPVDIDLTGPDTNPDVKMSAVGNSADQPIELDLEAMEIDMAMSDLFGDADSGSNNDGSAVEGLFTPVLPDPNMSLTHSLGDSRNTQDEESFLSALDGRSDDIFASLGANAHDNTQSAPSGSAPSASMSAPSPGSLLASFSQMGDPSQSSHGNLSSEGAPAYDLDALDLSNLSPGFFGDPHNSDMGFDMEELLSMGGDETGDAQPNIKMEP
ncbi:hypothetical protein DFH09DRAFT_1456578 [Mycena vulgaris]|nr:hypothetical protein DFH09DRAFT_1456578 [Mycena vulgaris]